MYRKPVVIRVCIVLWMGLFVSLGLLTQAKNTVRAATPIPTLNANGMLEIVPSATAVKSGDTFDLAVKITIDVPTCDAQAGMTFDSNLVEITGVDEGDFYKNYADANGIQSIMVPNQAVPDNANGTLPFTGVALIGGKCGPTGSGSLYVVHLKAKKDGSAKFSLTDIIVQDDASHVKSKGVPMPVAYSGIQTRDLVVNIGGAAAPEQPTRPALVPTPVGNQLPTQEATAVLLPTQADSNGSGGTAFPWVIAIPVVGVVVIAGVIILTSRKPK